MPRTPGGAQPVRYEKHEAQIERDKIAEQLSKSQLIEGKLPRSDALRRTGLMVENCTYGQPYDQCAEST